MRTSLEWTLRWIILEKQTFEALETWFLHVQRHVKWITENLSQFQRMSACNSKSFPFVLCRRIIDKKILIIKWWWWRFCGHLVMLAIILTLYWISMNTKIIKCELIKRFNNDKNSKKDSWKKHVYSVKLLVPYKV